MKKAPLEKFLNEERKRIIEEKPHKAKALKPPKAKWSALNHCFFKTVKRFKHEPILVAVSGGLDSMVLWDLLVKAGFTELVVAHVHHGGRSQFRNQSALVVKQQAQKLGILFYLLGPSPQNLQSEAEMRLFRHHELELLRAQLLCKWIAFAHHQDDLLETRLLQLIRGTGVAGLQSLAPMAGTKWRPLLGVSRQQLEQYAKEQGLQWVEDPSNKSPRYLRNWLRHRWLSQLEKRRPGGVQCLARSLQNLADACSEEKFLLQKKPSILKMAEYIALSPAQQRKKLAQALLNSGYKDFSLGQLKEIQKRLDKNQKQHRFSVGRMIWEVNAGLIQTRFAPHHKT
jgi:tRNA(Ile)-lysidine synthase